MKVLISDDNVEFVNSVVSCLERRPEFEQIDVAFDGKETLKKIFNNNPDVVLLDVIMPYLDGVGVITELLSKGVTNLPVIILTSSISQDYMVKKAIDLGASCFLLKPFDEEYLADRILLLAQPKKKVIFKPQMEPYINLPGTSPKADAEVQVTNLIHHIGVPPNISGHQYLREAVLQVVEDRGLISGITKELYPNVAKKCNTSSSRVERAIRHAIEVSWNRGREDFYEEAFGYYVNMKRGRPTNGEFIAMLADRARNLLNVPSRG